MSKYIVLLNAILTHVNMYVLIQSEQRDKDVVDVGAGLLTGLVAGLGGGGCGDHNLAR